MRRTRITHLVRRQKNWMPMHGRTSGMGTPPRLFTALYISRPLEDQQLARLLITKPRAFSSPRHHLRLFCVFSQTAYEDQIIDSSYDGMVRRAPLLTYDLLTIPVARASFPCFIRVMGLGSGLPIKGILFNPTSAFAQNNILPERGHKPVIVF